MENETDIIQIEEYEYKADKNTKFTGFLLAVSKFIAGVVFFVIYVFTMNILFLAFGVLMIIGGIGFLFILRRFNKIAHSLSEKENNSQSAK